MMKIRHIVNIYISLFHYKKKLVEDKQNEDAEEIQETINYILDKNVTEIMPLGRIGDLNG